MSLFLTKLEKYYIYKQLTHYHQFTENLWAMDKHLRTSSWALRNTDKHFSPVLENIVLLYLFTQFYWDDKAQVLLYIHLYLYLIHNHLSFGL